jgi:membrane-associated protein
MIGWLSALLTAHGGLLILPLAVIEGPIVSIVAGWLCRRGQLAWPRGIALLVCGDLIGDLLYYWLGRSGQAPLRGFGRWLGVPTRLPARLAEALRANATKMLLVGKWTQSIGAIVLIGAGMMRLSLLRFTIVNLLATVVKSSVLFGVGYFAWPYYLLLASYPVPASILLLAVGSAATLLILRVGRGAGAGDRR